MLLTVPAAVALAVVPVRDHTCVVRARCVQAVTDTLGDGGCALAIFAWGLPAFVLIKVFSPAYFAREDTKTPMRFATISLIANTAGSIGLFFLFRSMGLLPQLGIALASALGGWLNALLLWSTLAKRGQFVLDGRARRALPLIVGASLVMGAALWGGAHYLAPWLASAQPLWVKSAALAALIGGALVIYGVAMAATGVLRASMFRRRARTVA